MRPPTYSSGREAKRAAGLGDPTGGPDVVLEGEAEVRAELGASRDATPRIDAPRVPIR